MVPALRRAFLLAIGMVSSAGGVIILIAATGRQACGDATAETVLKYQQAYFQNITSLQLAATTTIKMGERMREAAGLPQATLQFSGQFAHCGDRGYAQLTYFDFTSKTSEIQTCAYDGEKYHVLTGKEKPVLSVTPGDVGKTNMEANAALHPMALAFTFLLSDTREFSLGVLQDDGKWAPLAGQVEDTHRVSLLGREGVRLAMRVPSRNRGGSDLWEVFFASDVRYFPMWWHCLRADGTVAECKVTKLEHRDGLTGRLPVPVELELSESLATGEVMQEAHTTVDPGSLKVNEAMDDTAFVVPVSLASMYVNETTGARFRPIGRDPDFARLLMNSIYQGSLGPVADSLAEEAVQEADGELTSAVAMDLKRRYGQVNAIDLVSNERAGGLVVETVWGLMGELGAFQMKLTLNEDDRVTEVRFRGAPEQEWRSIRAFVSG